MRKIYIGIRALVYCRCHSFCTITEIRKTSVFPQYCIACEEALFSFLLGFSFAVQPRETSPVATPLSFAVCTTVTTILIAMHTQILIILEEAKYQYKKKFICFANKRFYAFSCLFYFTWSVEIFIVLACTPACIDSCDLGQPKGDWVRHLPCVWVGFL